MPAQDTNSVHGYVLKGEDEQNATDTSGKVRLKPGALRRDLLRAVQETSARSHSSKLCRDQEDHLDLGPALAGLRPSRPPRPPFIAATALAPEPTALPPKLQDFNAMLSW